MICINWKRGHLKRLRWLIQLNGEDLQELSRDFQQVHVHVCLIQIKQRPGNLWKVSKHQRVDDMKLALIGRAVCAATVIAMGLSSLQARSPMSYMYILMVNMIGPAGNSLSQTAAMQTLSDQDWNRVKQMATRLSESVDAVSSGGTTPTDIERAKSSEWKSWAGKFADTVSLAVNAAERRNQTALITAADDLMDICKGCHTAFPQAPQ